MSKRLLLALVAAVSLVGAAAFVPAIQSNVLNLCPGTNLCLGAGSNGVIEFWTDGSKKASISNTGAFTADGGFASSGAVSGTTGTFTSTVTGVAGTFSGAVTGTTGGFSAALTGLTVASTGDVSGTTGTFTGAILGLKSVEVSIVSKTPTEAESGEVYTNTGDGDGSTFTLPNDPTIGLEYTVIATAAQTITITASAGETIEANGATCGTSVTLGDGDSVIFISATAGSGAQWHVVGGQGFTCNA